MLLRDSVEKRQRGPEHPVTRARARVENRRVSKLEKKGVGGVGSKMVKNDDFWAKNGQKWPKSGIFGQIFFFFSRFLPSIAPRLKAPCPPGSRPPIYTVLNAAFSALNTLSGGTVVGHHSPAASHSLPEHSPREFRRSQRRPQIMRVGFLLQHYFFLFKNCFYNFYFIFFIIINTKVFDATCKKYFFSLRKNFCKR